ncbi:MAG: polysaccharide biosynthesis protein, partial [Acetatifactor sp.]|nr:polysaccharide biosynthesis protein [Acetatifactor sp.]
MVVGAGASGNAILQEIQSSKYLSMHVACFIDDNPGCQGKFLRGVPIVGGREKIVESVEKYDIDEIIIAIPSASRSELKPLLEICKETGCRIQILPGMYQIIKGDVNVSNLREVQIEDLLGRDPIEVNVDEIIGYVQDKTVLVTGGGGSIGSELCRQIAGHNPKRLIIVDIYENNAYDIQQELRRDYPELDLVVLIASVRNTMRVEEIFRTYRPDIVYHAAAHKHVPLMEDSPNEAIKNNVFGTLKVAVAADRYGTGKFVMISTDKAVNPTNIMGASKRICEMVIQNINRRSKTEYVAVRFGNVLGSNGSVVPLFKKQIEQGGPVTVTHPDIIRYFMTIPEAVSLVLQAGAYAKGGEIFVLDMGEPMKILDLARNMIKLSGYRVDEDIKIEFTGLRPGEKMYEELLMREEGLKETANRMIYIGRPIEYDDELFEQQLERLQEASVHESQDIRALVQEIVPSYQYEE